ncbi:MAG TPA: hypothetical protein VFB33_03465 [Candidatus Binataceae bacterium]|nr:hypothetical protein [Candidatus Binataceae bacterium]
MSSIRLTRALAVAAIIALASPLFIRGIAAAEDSEVRIKRTSVDISHGSGAEPGDHADVTAVFKLRSQDGCESPDKVLSGAVVTMAEGSCASAPQARVTIPSFRRVSGTNLEVFEGETIEGETADAVVRRMPTPANACAKFKLKVDVSHADLSSINANPLALAIHLPDGSSGCAEVNSARIDQ